MSHGRRIDGLDADAFEGSAITNISLDIFDSKTDVTMEALYKENMLRQSKPTIRSLELLESYSNLKLPGNAFAPAVELRNLKLRALGTEFNCRHFKGLK